MILGLAIASIILSTLCLVAIIILSALFVAKHYFSEHIIERVPVGSYPFDAGQETTPIVDPFKEVGEPLTDEERAYFEKLNKG
jgi:hypothetical protein